MKHSMGKRALHDGEEYDCLIRGGKKYLNHPAGRRKRAKLRANRRERRQWRERNKG